MTELKAPTVDWPAFWRSLAKLSLSTCRPVNKIFTHRCVTGCTANKDTRRINVDQWTFVGEPSSRVREGRSADGNNGRHTGRAVVHRVIVSVTGRSDDMNASVYEL